MMEKALSVSGRNNLNYDFMVVTYAAILMKTNRADRALGYLNQEITESPLYEQAWSTRAELHYQRRRFWRRATTRGWVCASLRAMRRRRMFCGGWMRLLLPSHQIEILKMPA